MRSAALSLVLCVTGCGLVLDTAPPDLDAGAPRDAQAVFDSGRTDSGQMDSGSMDSGSADAGADPCADAQRGAPCVLAARPGVEAVCVDGVCVENRCGDGVVDPRTEACDDGNAVDDDGCRRDCNYTCERDLQCPVEPGGCALPSTCEANVCVSASQPDGTTCTRLGVTGTCRGGRCAPPDCGNGLIDPGEACDQGADLEVDDGCTPDCEFSCVHDSDCDDGVFCTGEERCVDNSVGRACAVDPIVCPAPPDGCGAPSCDPSSDRCVVTPFDADSDGFGAGSCGGDCDDGNPSVNPGAIEVCNEVDDDCDMVVDDGFATFRCFPDADGDGFGRAGGGVDRCACRANEVTLGGDCLDSTAPIASMVNPSVTSFFDASYTNRFGAPSFDYDCDGLEELEHPNGTNTGYTLACGPVDGDACDERRVWQGSVPACGQTGTFTRCVRSGMGCLRSSIAGFPQRCR